MDLTIYTDSAAAIWAVKGFDNLTPGRRLRRGSRPVVVMLEGEEQVVFWSEDRHVIGDLRAEVH